MTQPGADTTATVQAIKDNAQRLGLTWQIQYATVTDGSSAGAIIVTFDGDSLSVPTPAVSLVGVLTDGLRVAVLTTPPDGAYVIGILTDLPSAQTTTMVYGQPAFAQTVSGGYVNIGTASPEQFSFTKMGAATDVKVEAHIQFFVTAAPTTALFALTDGTAIVECARRSVSVANSHVQASAVTRLVGMGAGVHTMNLQWARLVGAGTLTINTDDTIAIALTEIPPL